IENLANAQTLTSPDRAITLTVNTGPQLSYDVQFKGNDVAKANAISLTLADGKALGSNGKTAKRSQRSVNQTVKPPYGMAAQYPDQFNELTLDFKDNFSVIFRVYNSGVAYRFTTRFPGKIKVRAEQTEYNFSNATRAWMQSGKGHNFYEDQYLHQEFSTLSGGRVACLPFLVDAPVKAAILETDVLDYPTMLLAANNKGGVKGAFLPVVAKDSLSGGSHFERIPYEFADYIAETAGTRSFPWRILVLAEQDKDLLYNNLTYLLASENKLGDVSWVKPGKVAWDWYNANNLSGVDFKTGYNTDTYKYYIDFAARNGVEYIMLDEGWSDQFDLLKLNDGSIKTNDGLKLSANMNMPALFDYAKKKGVGVLLWCVWHTLDRQMTEALDQFQKWGVAGVKVDFMSRDDQYVVNFYERLARGTAKRKMLVDFHGCFTPKGLERAYPNVINYEAVKGLEWNKFSDQATPEEVAHIPFIRALAGPMDYTPGGLHNAVKSDYRLVPARPMTQGTRCQQLAMFTLFYAPMEMLADAPTAYEKEPVILNYLAKMPTVWDETVPLDGKIGDFAVLARRKGSTWHVGAINDYAPRKVKVKLDFLEASATYT
ncbi:MAG: glycoside hydrolase family 97 protein, partial [Sphingobacteriaceae bacterium]|nr:glycoside hydrolase family 97 protein [Cytophagaceae bacterium]